MRTRLHFRCFRPGFRCFALGVAAWAAAWGCAEPPGGSPVGSSGSTSGDGEEAVWTPSTEDLVRELEGLSFVPSGRTFIGSPLDVGSPKDLVVDSYEVRHSLWELWIGPEDPIPGAFHPSRSWRDTVPRPAAWTAEVPAVGMTLEEARRFAGQRGMRLPTFDEWLWCAVGPTCRRFPAGRRQRGFANTLDTDLQRTTPVGAFESGQTPETGLYDMLGNVWEWIEPPAESRRSWWRIWNESAWPEEDERRAPAWVLGGSFMTPEGPVFTRSERLLALAVTEEHRSSEIGFRCCADAGDYLAALPEGAPLSSDHRRRLQAVGARWGPRAEGAIEEALSVTPGQTWLTALARGIRGEGAR